MFVFAISFFFVFFCFDPLFGIWHLACLACGIFSLVEMGPRPLLHKRREPPLHIDDRLQKESLEWKATIDSHRV